MKALVLCGGFGTRLGALTQDTPKPLLEAGGRPLVEWILLHLNRHGFTDIAINLHYRPEAIQKALGDGSRLGVKIHYFYEPELLGTAGTVKNLREFLGSEGTFLVHYGDVVTNHDFTSMVAHHRQKPATATILVHERPGSNSVVGLDDSRRVTAFLERPDEATRKTLTSQWVNSGITLCEPEIFPHIPDNVPADLPKHVFPQLLQRGNLFAEPLLGFRCAVDSVDRLQLLDSALRNQRLFPYD